MELGYDVFLVPAQPFVEPEAPRPGDPPSWSPPVDALLTADQAERLGEWIAASGKRLTAIYLTRGHGDHFLGLPILLRRFPQARAIATRGTVDLMRRAPPTTSLGRALAPACRAP